MNKLNTIDESYKDKLTKLIIDYVNTNKYCHITRIEDFKDADVIFLMGKNWVLSIIRSYKHIKDYIVWKQDSELDEILSSEWITLSVICDDIETVKWNMQTNIKRIIN